MPEPTISDAAKAAAYNEHQNEEWKRAYKPNPKELGSYVQGYADRQTAEFQKRVAELEIFLRESTKRDGSWLDELGVCRVCGGEIPHGHTDNCDVFKLEQKASDRDALKAQLDEANEQAEQTTLMFQQREADIVASTQERDQLRARAETAERERDAIRLCYVEASEIAGPKAVKIEMELEAAVARAVAERDEARAACAVKDEALKAAFELSRKAIFKVVFERELQQLQSTLVVAQSNTEGASLMQELIALQKWKAEAITVMAPLQELGHELNLPLGVSIHDKLVATLRTLKERKNGVLMLARDKFREFARLHLAKNPPQVEKAAANTTMAELCDEALK